MNGYHVDPRLLTAASGQIADAMSGADNLELETIAEKGAIFGADPVATALSDFCTTWELATGILQQRLASAGEALDGAAKAYVEEELRNKLRPPVPSPTPASHGGGGSW